MVHYYKIDFSFIYTIYGNKAMIAQKTMKHEGVNYDEKLPGHIVENYIDLSPVPYNEWLTVISAHFRRRYNGFFLSHIETTSIQELSNDTTNGFVMVDIAERNGVYGNRGIYRVYDMRDVRKLSLIKDVFKFYIRKR